LVERRSQEPTDQYGKRRRLGETESLSIDREIREPQELTFHATTRQQVAQTKEALNAPFRSPNRLWMSALPRI